MLRGIRWLALLPLLVMGGLCHADDKPYTEGTVWSVTLIKVKPGMLDVYLRDVLPMRKKIDEAARSAGLLLSSHILSGSASNKDDWDLILMDEYKNFAALDGLSAKYDAIMNKVVGNESQRLQTMIKRTEVRDIVGDKLMQELVAK
ncbi:MAG: hypothetical protein JOY60_06295 [Burkholderiaceae bacterium]|nr:hypothetical protein [Roseateles sp.]MBV8469458.1 hypothetical protein [Burkholderiaceae bacterium]